MGSLSKKHFIKVAEILNQQIKEIALNDKRDEQIAKAGNNSAIHDILFKLSDYFATENAQFDRQRFKEAVLKGVVE